MFTDKYVLGRGGTLFDIQKTVVPGARVVAVKRIKGRPDEAVACVIQVAGTAGYEQSKYTDAAGYGGEVFYTRMEAVDAMESIAAGLMVAA